MRRTTRKKAAARTNKGTRRRSVTKRVSSVRRRRTTRRKGGLSEFFNPGQAAEAAKVVVEGAAGGVGAHFLNKVLPSTINPAQKAVITVGAGFITAAMFKRPILGAGMAAIGVMNLLTETKLLAEDTNGEFTSDELDNLPMVLNENTMYALSEGNGMYLSEDYLQEDTEFESPGTDYEVGYYPEFGGI